MCVDELCYRVCVDALFSNEYELICLNEYMSILVVGSMPPDLTNLLDKDAQEENVYNTAGLLPHMKTFYNKPNTVPIPVAPYASTTIINTGGQFPKPLPVSTSLGDWIKH